MSGLAVVFGGSGFVGRYITRKLADRGWRVRVAVRRPNEAGFVRTYGTVGQVEPMLANIRDDASVAKNVAGADIVVNCVGILNEIGKNGFEAVQAEGAGRIARACREAGVPRLVHISAIGADAGSNSAYQRSKAEGEAQIQAAFPEAVILRPSVIFGTEDEFFNRFAGMARMSPFLPLIGAETKFQPVWVGDVAEAAFKAAMGEVQPGIYELGGPRQASFREWMQVMLGIINRRRFVVDVPIGLGRMMGKTLDFVQRATGGLITNKVLTADQVESLSEDNVVAENAAGFEAFGITPCSAESVLPDYLWVYRSSGQFAELTESAKDLPQ